MQHPTNPQDGPPVKTLHAAKLLIRELQQRMGLYRSSGNVPLEPDRPSAKATALLHPRESQPVKTGEVNLAGLSPKGLRDYFDNATLPQLRECLARETAKDRKHQEPSIVGALYREIRSRR